MKYHYCFLTPKAETRESSIAGKGTFATDKIAKGELIAAFGGKIVNQKGYDLLPEGLGELYLTIDEDLFIGPSNWEHVGNGDFINHSCNPNAGIKGQIKLIAMKEIMPEEEITFDYAMVVSDPLFNITCGCCQKECRGEITGYDWSNKSLQDKYKGYFSEYLKNKIK